MNKDQVNGRTKTVAGEIQEAVGKATGDKRTQIAGTIRKNSGKAQALLGDVKKEIDKEIKKDE